MKKIFIILAIGIVAIIIAWFIIKKPVSTIKPSGPTGEEGAATQVESSGFGGQIFEKVQQNPAEKLPDANPFEEEINPYKDAYTNPFE